MCKEYSCGRANDDFEIGYLSYYNAQWGIDIWNGLAGATAVLLQHPFLLLKILSSFSRVLFFILDTNAIEKYIQKAISQLTSLRIYIMEEQRTTSTLYWPRCQYCWRDSLFRNVFLLLRRASRVLSSSPKCVLPNCDTYSWRYGRFFRLALLRPTS